MKRNLITILSLVVMSLMFNATGAYAQSYAKADVPFAFNVGSALLPAGTYEVRPMAPGTNGMIIQNSETRAAALSSARRERPRNAESKLVFDHVGSHYFLTEVWRGSDGGMIAPTSKHEQQLKKELEIAKGSSSGQDKVVIALK
jgi:hypothetical protein